MFAKGIICIVALVGFVAAEVPSYIKVCGARNPQLNQCVLESVAKLNQRLRSGIPELDVPAMDPINIEKVYLADLPNFRASATNITLYGLADYSVDHLNLDLAKKEVTMRVHIDQLKIEALYDVFARILVPLEGRGPIHLICKGVKSNSTLNFKTIPRNGKTYVYFSSMKTQVAVSDYTAKFETEGLNNVALQEAINQAFHDNHQELLESTLPNVEKAISEQGLKFANRICKHFTYEELFPDRE